MNPQKNYSVDHFIINMPFYATEALRLSNDPAVLELMEDPSKEQKEYAQSIKDQMYSAWLSLRVGQAAFRIRKFAADTGPDRAVAVNSIHTDMCLPWLGKQIGHRWAIIVKDFSDREQVYATLSHMRGAQLFDCFNPFHILTIADIRGGVVPAGEIDFVVGVWEKSIGIHLEDLSKWLLEKVKIDPINTHIVHMVG